MSLQHDDSKRTGSAGFTFAGSGHVSGWQCAVCQSKKWTQTGRRLLRVRGVKQWVCVNCVRGGA